MNDPSLRSLLAHATGVPARDREELAQQLQERRPGDSVLIVTCHRVELHGISSPSLDALAGDLPAGTRVIDGIGVAEHVIALAVGLRSASLAEDQVLHQIRTSLEAARSRGRLPAELDRLFDVALRAGRLARSWLPSRRPSLADLALDLVPGPLAGRRVLVVGAGQMGRLSAIAARSRGADVWIASRSSDRADALAAQLRVDAAPFDPGAGVAGYAVVVVALRGTWNVEPTTAARLLGSDAAVIDLSAPPALPVSLAEGLGDRLVTIDDLARRGAAEGEDALVARLGRLADATLAEYREWLEHGHVRAAARAMAERAERARHAELGDLWQRLPDLRSDERAEIERMTRHLSDRLLREPLERLGRDVDGRHEQAARELFGL